MDDNGHLLDYYMAEVNIVRMMLERSSNVFVAMDSAKFKVRAPIEIGLLKNMDALFVDSNPPANITSLVKEQGIELIKP